MNIILNLTGTELKDRPSGESVTYHRPGQLMKILDEFKPFPSDHYNRLDLYAIMDFVRENKVTTVIMDQFHSIYVKLFVALLECEVNRWVFDHDNNIVEAHMDHAMRMTDAQKAIIDKYSRVDDLVEHLNVRYGKELPPLDLTPDGIWQFIVNNTSKTQEWIRNNYQAMRQRIQLALDNGQTAVPTGDEFVFGTQVKMKEESAFKPFLESVENTHFAEAVVTITQRRFDFLHECGQLFDRLKLAFGNPSAVPLDVLARAVIHILHNTDEGKQEWVVDGLQRAFQEFENNWHEILMETEFEWNRYLAFAKAELVELRTVAGVQCGPAIELVSKEIKIKIDVKLFTPEPMTPEEAVAGCRHIFPFLSRAYGHPLAVPIASVGAATFHHINVIDASADDFNKALYVSWNQVVEGWAAEQSELSNEDYLDFLTSTFDEIVTHERASEIDATKYKDVVRQLYRERVGEELPEVLPMMKIRRSNVIKREESHEETVAKAEQELYGVAISDPLDILDTAIGRLVVATPQCRNLFADLPVGEEATRALNIGRGLTTPVMYLPDFEDLYPDFIPLINIEGDRKTFQTCRNARRDKRLELRAGKVFVRNELTVKIRRFQ